MGGCCVSPFFKRYLYICNSHHSHFLIHFIQNKKVGDEILDLLNVPSHKVRIEDLEKSCPKSVLCRRSGNPAGFWHTYWQLSQTPHPLVVSTISHLDILHVKIKFQSTLFDSQIPPSAYLAAWPLLLGWGGVGWGVVVYIEMCISYLILFAFFCFNF